MSCSLMLSMPLTTMSNVPFSWCSCAGHFGKIRLLSYCITTLRVRTHQYSPVEFSQIQSNQTSKHAADTSWFTYNGRVRECVHTSRAEPSRVPWVLPSQESWRRMVRFGQSGSSDRVWWLLFGVGKPMYKSWFFSLRTTRHLRCLSLLT
jgi:hypothetical protein